MYNKNISFITMYRYKEKRDKQIIIHNHKIYIYINCSLLIVLFFHCRYVFFIYISCLLCTCVSLIWLIVFPHADSWSKHDNFFSKNEQFDNTFEYTRSLIYEKFVRSFWPVKQMFENSTIVLQAWPN